MITAIDTSVLFAISNREASWEAWKKCLNDAADSGDLIICPVVFAEYAARFDNVDKVRSALNGMSLRWSNFNEESSFLAGRIFTRYRRNKGPRKTMLPDFLIAAHAGIQADRLAAIDRGYLRNYFPDLQILTP